MDTRNTGTEIVASAGRMVVIRPPIATDDELIASWLKKYVRENTKAAYDADVRAFRAFVGLPLQAVAEGDIEAYADSLTELAASTQSRRLSAVKSLFAYGSGRKYLPLDVGADIPLPGIKDALGERILSVEQVLKLLMTAEEPKARPGSKRHLPKRKGPFMTRNATLLRLVYGTGLRVSEVCGLRWRDFAPHGDGAYMTAFGKGDKTRTILLPAALWARVTALRGATGPTDHVFRSRKGGGLTRQQIYDIFKEVAQRAGLPAAASPHWLRHAHVSHALDNGAPVHVVQFSAGHASLTTTTRYTHVRPEDSSARYIRM
jgi:site-specific recombinase XerD